MQSIDLDDVEITLQTLPHHKDMVLKYITPTTLNETLVMTLDKDQAISHEAYPVTALHESNAPDIAAVMQDAFGKATDHRILQNMSSFQWIGIKRPHLVSVGRYRCTDWVGWMSIVATMQMHRNQGYASTIVSHAVTNLLEKHDEVLIHVRADNVPAIHVYQKVGFSHYKTYIFIRGRKIVDV